jgi:hypothetical protein
MSKLFAIVTSVKANFIDASVAFARGDVLPAILLSTLFNLVQLGAKPAGRAERDAIVVSRSHDARDRFRNHR